MIKTTLLLIPYLTILFEIYDVSRPVLDDQLGELSWQECDLGEWFTAAFHTFCDCYLITTKNKEDS